MKDNFSTRSNEYRKYRPQYPADVYDIIRQHLSEYKVAWDCGTGNGQVASVISDFFDLVEATDISENQLENATKKNNINYSRQPAERINFRSNCFDLIIAAQAVHWFDFDQFYVEVNRCLKLNGLFVILGYALFRSNPETNKVIDDLYRIILGPYWDKERTYLDQNYSTIPFPFKEIHTPHLVQEYNWDVEHLLGYLRTWSAVKHFQKKNHIDPVTLIESELRKAFGPSNQITFPILFRMGKPAKADQ